MKFGMDIGDGICSLVLIGIGIWLVVSCSRGTKKKTGKKKEERGQQKKSWLCRIGLHKWWYFSGIPRNEFDPAPVLRSCRWCKKQQKYIEKKRKRGKWEPVNYQGLRFWEKFDDFWDGVGEYVADKIDRELENEAKQEKKNG